LKETDMTRIQTFFALTGLGLVLAGQAEAHAHLQSAFPADKSVVASAEEIDLTFSEALNLKFSGLELIGPDNKAVAIGEPMLMDNDTMLMVPLTGDFVAGQYRVEWHVLSADGHKTKGSYTFTIKP
jgi:copper resistance protein C